MESSLSRLAELVRARNTVESNMVNLIEREVHLNSVGEHIAANVFGIRLVPTTIQSGFVGIFTTPALSGKTVDIRWYPRRESYINIHTDPAPDYSLILAGPRVEPGEARGLANPWLLTSVYLFSMQDLLASLRARGVRIGPRVSINSQLWELAELFPVQRNPTLMLTDSQRQLLKLFA
jgi:hypothetical protein